MPGKRVTFGPEDWVALDQLARERHVSFQELAQEAFRDVLKKHERAAPSKGTDSHGASVARASRSAPKRMPRRSRKAANGRR
jgi:hypothetical protein